MNGLEVESSLFTKSLEFTLQRARNTERGNLKIELSTGNLKVELSTGKLKFGLSTGLPAGEARPADAQ